VKVLTEAQSRYWSKYLDTLSPNERPDDAFVEASFAGNRDATDYLLSLYLDGKKHAGSGILEDFISSGDPSPKVGNYWIFLDSKDEPRCILRTERIALNKFKDVPAEIAAAEAEGDLSLEHWKRTHAKFYAPFLSTWGLSDINEATVVTEFFKIVFRYP